MRALNAKVRGNSFAQFIVDGNDVGLAVQRKKTMALREGFEFFLDFRLVKNEGLKQIIGKGKIPPGFPITDGVRFAKFAFERNFRAHVQPKCEIGTNRHFV